jgi:hypothetical protein
MPTTGPGSPRRGSCGWLRCRWSPASGSWTGISRNPWPPPSRPAARGHPSPCIPSAGSPATASRLSRKRGKPVSSRTGRRCCACARPPPILASRSWSGTSNALDRSGQLGFILEAGAIVGHYRKTHLPIWRGPLHGSEADLRSSRRPGSGSAFSSATTPRSRGVPILALWAPTSSSSHQLAPGGGGEGGLAPQHPRLRERGVFRLRESDRGGAWVPVPRVEPHLRSDRSHSGGGTGGSRSDPPRGRGPHPGPGQAHRPQGWILG